MLQPKFNIAVIGMSSANISALESMLQSQLAAAKSSLSGISAQVIEAAATGEAVLEASLREKAIEEHANVQRLQVIVNSMDEEAETIDYLPVITIGPEFLLVVDKQQSNEFTLQAPGKYICLTGDFLLSSAHGAFLATISSNKKTTGDAVEIKGIINTSMQKESATSLRKGGVFKTPSSRTQSSSASNKKPAQRKASTSKSNSSSASNKKAPPKASTELVAAKKPEDPKA